MVGPHAMLAANSITVSMKMKKLWHREVKWLVQGYTAGM